MDLVQEIGKIVKQNEFHYKKTPDSAGNTTSKQSQKFLNLPLYRNHIICNRSYNLLPHLGQNSKSSSVS